MTTLTTPRLHLVPMANDHLDGLFAINSDPEVMRYITGQPETREGTQAMIERVKARWAEWGFSWWSFIERDSNEIIGMGCIQHLARDSANPLEIGWRLRPDKHHQGLASEAAQHMAAFAFESLEAPLLTAVCQPPNTASARVMQRLGMRYRGLERWYDVDCSTYEVTRVEWDTRRLRTTV